MSESLIEEPKLDESKPEEPKPESEILLKKVNFEARPPDFVGNDHNVVAWISAINTTGEIITLNIKIGELRFKIRKRYL
jgi:hypothetical protein